MKKIAIIVLAVIFYSVCSLFAAGKNFDISTEVFYLHYREPGVMENKGFLYGTQVSYEFIDRALFRIESRAALGTVDYKSKNTGSMDDNDEFLFETRALAGIEFNRLSYYFTPYFGIGYRYLRDDSSGSQTTTGAYGYERNSNYVYSPLGVSFDTDIAYGWGMKVYSEIDIFWFGVQYSHLGDALPGHPTVRNNQDSGYGYKGGIRVEKRYEKSKVMAEFFYHYWRISDSDTDTVVYSGSEYTYIEPRNSTQEIGLRFSYSF